MESIQDHHGGLESNASEENLKSEHSAQPGSNQQTGKDPLTMLPVELQNMSFKSLNVLDKLNLKFVNKYFHAFIPQYSHADYLKAEKLEGAIGKFYACFICCRFRPRSKFADNSRIQTKGVSHLSLRFFSAFQFYGDQCLNSQILQRMPKLTLI